MVNSRNTITNLYYFKLLGIGHDSNFFLEYQVAYVRIINSNLIFYNNSISDFIVSSHAILTKSH